MILKSSVQLQIKPYSSHGKARISRHIPPLKYTKSSSVHNFRVPAPVEGTRKEYDQVNNFVLLFGLITDDSSFSSLDLGGWKCIKVLLCFMSLLVVHVRNVC